MLTPGPRRLARCAAAAAAVTSATILPLTAAGPASADQARQRQQWVLTALDVRPAWQATQGQGVTVAVIDSGVDPTVSDLTGQVRTGPDYTGVHTPMSNPNWGVHGTWMASLIAGHGHGRRDTNGILGVAPKSHVLSIRVITDQSDPNHTAYLDEPGWKGQRELADAIRYAVAHHAGVISMSLGYSAPSISVRSALQYALHRNVIVVASSGNSGTTHSTQQHGSAPYSFPADYPGVIGVAAVSQSGKAAPFSSENLSVEVAAPGVNVPAEGRGSKYWVVSGTSPACALTAGVAALVKSKYPKLTAAQVRAAIISSSAHRPRRGYDDRTGFGTVDAAAALRAASRLSHEVPAGQTAAGRRAAEGNFGAGSAVPAFPVAPQSRSQILILLGVGVVSLLVLILALRRLVRRRRRRASVTRAAVPGPPGMVPGPAQVPQPGPSGPDVRYPTQIFPAQPFRQGRPAPGTIAAPVQGYPVAGYQVQPPGSGGPGQQGTGMPAAPATGYPGPGYADGGWQTAGPPHGPWSQAENGYQQQLPPGEARPGLDEPALLPGQAASPSTSDDSDDWAFEQDEPAGETGGPGDAESPPAAPVPGVSGGSQPSQDVSAPAVTPAAHSPIPPQSAEAPQLQPGSQVPPAPASPLSDGPAAPGQPQSDMDRWLADPLTSPRVPDSVLGATDSWSAGQFSERLGRTGVTRPLRTPRARPEPAAGTPDAQQDQVQPTAAGAAAEAAAAAGRVADAAVWGRRTANGGSQTAADRQRAAPAASEPATSAPGDQPDGATDAGSAPESGAASRPDDGSGQLPRRQPLAERGPLPAREPFASGRPGADRPGSGQSMWDRPPSSARSSLWEKPAPSGLVPPERPGPSSRTSRLERVAMAGEGSAAAARSSLWDRASSRAASPGSAGLVGPAASAGQDGPEVAATAAAPAADDAAASVPAQGGAAAGSADASGPQPLPRRRPQTHLAAQLRPGPGRAGVASGTSAGQPSVWDVRRPATTGRTEGSAASDGSDGSDTGA